MATESSNQPAALLGRFRTIKTLPTNNYTLLRVTDTVTILLLHYTQHCAVRVSECARTSGNDVSQGDLLWKRKESVKRATIHVVCMRDESVNI